MNTERDIRPLTESTSKKSSLYGPYTGAVGFYEVLGYDEQPRIVMARWLDGRSMTC